MEKKHLANDPNLNGNRSPGLNLDEEAMERIDNTAIAAMKSLITKAPYMPDGEEAIKLRRDIVAGAYAYGLEMEKRRCYILGDDSFMQRVFGPRPEKD